MTRDLKSLLLFRLKNEFEIYILMIVFGAWYLFFIGGAMKGDETIFAWQGYYFVRGDMPAEQFRPLSRYFIGTGQIIFGRNTFGTKFFIYLFGILTVYLTYRITKQLSNRVFGFLAALILGLIPLYGDLSVSGFLDIILTFFGVCLLFFMLKFLNAEKLSHKQRLLFLVGALSVSTLATKLYGVFFSMVIFLFLIYTEWKTIKTITLFKRRNIATKIKKNLILLPVFIVLGALFGLLMRAQFSDMWRDAGEKGRADILEVLPGFLEDIVLNLGSSRAYAFFIALGIVIFALTWMIVSMVGRESLRTIKHLIKGKELNERYHVLIYILGAIIGFVVIYAPYISNPITLSTQILVNQTVHLAQSSPKEVGGVLYDSAPWWSYLYWTNVHLSVMFIAGIIISLAYTGFRYVKRDGVEKEQSLLFLYTFVPFILLSALSLKNQNYFVILFPLFTIFIVVQVTSLIKRIAARSSMRSLKNRADILSVAAVIALLLLPGPLWMTLDDFSRGYDSGYDEAADIVVRYMDDHPGEDITIVAYDVLSMEFYLPDNVRKDVEIIPLFSDNYSKDIIGRPNIYYPDEELYDMVLNNEIDLLVDEPKGASDRESLVRRHAQENVTALTWINDELLVYQLDT